MTFYVFVFPLVVDCQPKKRNAADVIDVTLEWFFDSVLAAAPTVRRLFLLYTFWQCLERELVVFGALTMVSRRDLREDVLLTHANLALQRQASQFHDTNNRNIMKIKTLSTMVRGSFGLGVGGFHIGASSRCA